MSGNAFWIANLANHPPVLRTKEIIDAFKGKSRVQQHQMVFQALQGRMGNELHALALQTSAPPEA